MNSAIKQSLQFEAQYKGRNARISTCCRVLHLLALMLILFSSVAAQPDAVLGVKLAYPVSALTMNESDSLFRCSEDEYFRLRLSIDETGALTSISAGEVIASSRLKEFERFFQQTRFEHGERDGRSVSQVLPATVYLFADGRLPLVTFPVGANGGIDEPSLYWQGLELNGVTLPRISRFPSYHSTLSGADTSSALRYVLASVQLNRKGTPTDIRLAYTNYRTFAAQVLTAVNWAKYRPARIDTQAVGSSGFILVSFFPAIQYPTRLLRIGSVDTAISLERLAVRFLPDTLGLLSGPIPRFVKNSSYPIAVKPGIWRHSGVFRYKIDIAGIPSLVSGGNGSAAATRFGNSLGAQMRFYPAIDNRGNSVAFEGAVKVTRDGESNVRVRFLWLQ